MKENHRQAVGGRFIPRWRVNPDGARVPQSRTEEDRITKGAMRDIWVVQNLRSSRMARHPELGVRSKSAGDLKWISWIQNPGPSIDDELIV